MLPKNRLHSRMIAISFQQSACRHPGRLPVSRSISHPHPAKNEQFFRQAPITPKKTTARAMNDGIAIHKDLVIMIAVQCAPQKRQQLYTRGQSVSQCETTEAGLPTMQWHAWRISVNLYSTTTHIHTQAIFFVLSHTRPLSNKRLAGPGTCSNAIQCKARPQLEILCVFHSPNKISRP